MKKYLILLASALFLFSCERNTDIEGPALSDLYGEFQILEGLQLSSQSVDFSTGQTISFTARFSSLSDWTITITGLNSGAVKVIEGKSRRLEPSNALWKGAVTELPMFKIEDCSIELYVERDSSFHYDTVSVTGTKSNSGFVVADFESGMNPDWDIFAQSGANMSFVIDSSVIAAEGDFYYDMGGEVTWDWLIGMIEFPADAYGNQLFPLSDNAERVYFNTFLYIPAGITNGVILFQFREDENADGAFNENNEDMYSLELKGLDAGWHHISIKYGDMVALSNGQPVDPNGNKIHNPDLLHKISVLMLANPSSGYSQALMDYVIFTEDAPLNP